jgi:hypothetical protein
MRKTNPITGEARGTGPQGQGTWGSLARNKRNSRWGRAILHRPSTLRSRPGAEGGCAKQTQFRAAPVGTTPGRRAASGAVQTNPICRRARKWARAGALSMPIGRHRLDAPLRETKPIPGYAARGGATGTWDERQMRKTNPILRLQISDCGLGQPCGGTPALRPAASGPARADRAKRTQFPDSRAAGNARLCETKPIRPQEHKGRRSGQLCKINPIPARGGPAPRWEPLSCKTKPIPLPGWCDFAVADDAPRPTMLWNAAWNRARLSEPRRKGAMEI